jgi:hypothetical protein
MQIQCLFEQLNRQFKTIFFFEDFSINKKVLNGFVRLELDQKTEDFFEDILIRLDVTDQKFVFLCI